MVVIDGYEIATGWLIFAIIMYLALNIAGAIYTDLIGQKNRGRAWYISSIVLTIFGWLQNPLASLYPIFAYYFGK